MDDDVFAEELVRRLNGLIDRGPKELGSDLAALFRMRAVVHGTTQESGVLRLNYDEPLYSLGTLGLLNSLVGAPNKGIVGAVTDPDTQGIKRFARARVKK